MIVLGLWNDKVVITGMATTTTPENAVIVGRTALTITGITVIMVGTTITTTPMIAMTEGMNAEMEKTTGVKDRIEVITKALRVWP